MNENLAFQLGTLFVLGIVAQWVSWRLRMPAILLLLVFGIAAGMTGIIDPNQLLGDLFMPFVSVSVAIILLEGGFSLKIDELKESGASIRNLISLGAVITWVITSFAAFHILKLSLELSLLLGSILIVSGPTVIMPILRNVRPKKNVSAILRWEAIFIDPIGAMFAALVFEIIVADQHSGGDRILISVFKMIGIGVCGGLVSGAFLQMLLKRYLVPDFLTNSFVLMTAIATFVLSNKVAPESGLFAVTILGVYLANQKDVDIKDIVVFKEDLSVLLISFLFILLAASLTVTDLKEFNLTAVLFVLVLVFVARPLSVCISTLGTKLKFKEKIFLACMAPRGIVAAAITAFFALRLRDAGFAGYERLVPVTFIVIIIAVLIYGLAANPLAKALGVAKARPDGFIIVGAHDWARDIASTLTKAGCEVLLVDTNFDSIQAAKAHGLNACLESVLHRQVEDSIELSGIGRLLALTPNSEINALAAMHFNEIFGHAGVFQLQPQRTEKGIKTPYKQLLKGRMLFDIGATYRHMNGRFMAGARIVVSPMEEDYSYRDYRKEFGRSSVPLFYVDDKGYLNVVTAGSEFSLKKGDKLIHLFLSQRDAELAAASNIFSLKDLGLT